MLPSNILFPHINHTEKPEQDAGGGNSVLASTCLGNHPGFTHAFHQKNLPEGGLDEVSLSAPTQAILVEQGQLTPFRILME